MIPTVGLAALSAGETLQLFAFERRELDERDLLLEVLYCGVCHSDLHQLRNDWGFASFPLVPGHEVIGRVLRLGSAAQRFGPQDIVGVGPYIDSCRSCPSCDEDLQPYCHATPTFAYGSLDRYGQRTRGGFSRLLVVDERYAFRIDPTRPLAAVAPLLCAGSSAYSALRRWQVTKGHRVGILGMGGLGHLAVQLASVMGAEVTVLSLHPAQSRDAQRFGATDFVPMTDGTIPATLRGRFDFLLDTSSGGRMLDSSLATLRRDGVLILLGLPAMPREFLTFSLAENRRLITSSQMAGLKETQEMLDYCAAYKIQSQTELIPHHAMNAALRDLSRGVAPYRFVLDVSTLPEG